MTAKAMETTFTGQKMNDIMTNMEKLTEKIDHTVDTVNKIIGDRKVEGILVEARDALSDTRGLIKKISSQVDEMKLAETTGKADRLIEDVDRRTRAITMDFNAVSENLRRTSDTLDMLLERLYTNPSDIIFGTPPPRRPGE